MSGPIVRKYGFPNFEKIFGEREIKHGAEAETPTPEPARSPTAGAETTPAPVGPMTEPPKNP